MVLLVIFSLPSIIAISFPFAALVGALMAVGRLSSDNEMLAFQAAGVPLSRIFVPVLALGIVFSFVSYSMNDYFLPLGTINFGKHYRKLLYVHPELELESYSIKRYEDSTIITGKVEGKEIHNIVIFDKTTNNDMRVILAERAKLAESEEQQGVISLLLENVFSQTPDRKNVKRFEYFTSDKMLYNILLSDITFALRNPGPREMSSYDVWKVIQSKSKALNDQKLEQQSTVDRLGFQIASYYRGLIDTLQSGADIGPQKANLSATLAEYRKQKNREIVDRSLQIYLLEFHKKFSIPFGCLSFVFFAFPVGLFTKRSGRSVGFGIGLFISILYWGILISGQTFGLRLNFSSGFSMWLPNIVILLLSIVAFAVRFKR